MGAHDVEDIWDVKELKDVKNIKATKDITDVWNIESIKFCSIYCASLFALPIFLSLIFFLLHISKKLSGFDLHQILL